MTSSVDTNLNAVSPPPPRPPVRPPVRHKSSGSGPPVPPRPPMRKGLPTPPHRNASSAPPPIFQKPNRNSSSAPPPIFQPPQKPALSHPKRTFGKKPPPKFTAPRTKPNLPRKRPGDESQNDFPDAPQMQKNKSAIDESPQYESMLQIAKDANQSSFVLPGYGKIKVPKEKFSFSEKSGSRSQWGPFAWYMAMDSCVAGIVCGFAAMVFSQKKNGKDEWTGIDGFAGVYCFLGSFIVYYIEMQYGQKRGEPGKAPLKAILYFGVSTLCWLSKPTCIVGMYLLCCSLLNYLAWRNEEQYDPPERKLRKFPVFSWCNKERNIVQEFEDWYHEIRVNGDWKKYLFALIWVGMNVFVIMERWAFHASAAQDLNDEADANGDPRVHSKFWLGMAKAFGTTLDINMTVILIPVCRTFIRMLYNYTTGSQNIIPVILRAIFSFAPLDSNLEWHKFMALFVYIATWAHTFAHFMNFSGNWKTYEDTYGEGIWVTGFILLLCVHIIFCSAFNDIRWGKFELFWYSHHTFVLFFFFTLIHGAGMWNPNFWKYLLLPLSLYTIERTIRVIRSRMQVGIVSVCHMRSKGSSVYAIEMEKKGAMKELREGQYVFLRAPTVSSNQWHPFTVASAPEHPTWKVIIRNQGPGTWTGKLQEYLELMGPKGIAFYNLTHMTDDLKLVPQYQGPDGKPIIQVDGPYAAPTQHCSEYNVSVIVGAGIGVTPVRATLESIVFFRWRKGLGDTFPNHAIFHWCVRWSDLATFAFMFRILKEAEDVVTNMKHKDKAGWFDAEGNPKKSYEVNIWISRVPKEVPDVILPGIQNSEEQPDIELEDAPLVSQKSIKKKLVKKSTTEMFGPGNTTKKKRDNLGSIGMDVKSQDSGIKELDLYRRCWEGQSCEIGHIKIHNGRPKWDDCFVDMKKRFCTDKVGIMVCGPAAIGDSIKKCCGKYSEHDEHGVVFKCHTENF